MVILKPITRDCAEDFCKVRLRALQDTPTAFGSTFAKESKLSPADWQARVDQWNGENAMSYLAWDGGEVCGIAGCFLRKEDTTEAVLISMWVAPAHRRVGVGKMLVNELIEWARGKMAQTFSLLVTCNNDSAIRFYERLGFAMTGKTEPYPNDASLVEFEMIRAIEQSRATNS